MKFIKKLFRPKEPQEQLKNSIDFPFEVIIVKGTDAPAKLFELRKSENITPVIMGKPSDLELLVDNFEMSEETVAEILSSAKKINFSNWFKERVSEDEEYYQIPHGDWPEAYGQETELSAHLNILTKKPLKQTIIGLIQTKDSWAVPAHLKFGGWNECPSPHEHVALFKKWEEEYSAKVASVTSDVIELTVDHPPTTKEQALKLAEEQFVYCSDIVFQGVETIENLASTLLNSKVWYFWWD